MRGEGPGIAELARILEENLEFPAGVIDVDAIVVFSSEQTRSGPVYEPLGTAMLQGK